MTLTNKVLRNANAIRKCTQESVINHIRKIVKDINKSGIHLERVILYGSYSRNEQPKWSDIDTVYEIYPLTMPA